MGLFDSTARWEGFLAAPLTPYDDAGNIDVDTYMTQVEFLIEQRVPALAALLHAAESLNLSSAERMLLAKLTVDVAADRAPVAVHVSCPGTDHTIELARHADAIGAKGVIAVTPYHWRPSDEGLLEHFAAVGEAIDTALIAYSHADAFGVSVTPTLAARLIDRLPNFLAMKEASHHLPTFAGLEQIVSELRPEVSLFSGLEYILANRVSGGAGSFSVCAVVAPRLVGALWDAVSRDDLAAARSLQERMSRLLALVLGRYPASLKAAADVLGRGLGGTRLPIPPLTSEERARLTVELDRCGLLDTEPYGWDPAGAPDPERARERGGVLATTG